MIQNGMELSRNKDALQKLKRPSEQRDCSDGRNDSATIGIVFTDFYAADLAADCFG